MPNLVRNILIGGGGTQQSDAPKIPGYRPIPLIGGRANLLRFFSDPIGHLLRLERRYGSVAALTAGDPSFVCAFGAEHNHAVLSDPASFRNFVQVPFPVPADSAASRVFKGIMSMNGDEHRRHRRLLQPLLGKAAVASYAADIVGVTDRFCDRWSGGGGGRGAATSNATRRDTRVSSMVAGRRSRITCATGRR